VLRKVQVLVKPVPGGNWLPSGMVSSRKAAWSQLEDRVGVGNKAAVGTGGSVGRLRVGAGVGTGVGGTGEGTKAVAVCVRAA